MFFNDLINNPYMQHVISHIHAWTKNWANSRFSLLLIFLTLFLDASILPLPTTVIFITISLIQPTRSYYNAISATAAMVLGGIAGYTIGHYLWLQPDGNYTQFARYLFDHIPNFNESSYRNVQSLYLNWKYSILFFTIILPIPYQVFSITAGAFDFNLAAFALSTLVFQGFRFFLLAWLIITYGIDVKNIVSKNLAIITIISILIILLIIFATKYGFI